MTAKKNSMAAQSWTIIVETMGSYSIETISLHTATHQAITLCFSGTNRIFGCIRTGQPNTTHLLGWSATWVLQQACLEAISCTSFFAVMCWLSSCLTDRFNDVYSASLLKAVLLAFCSLFIEPLFHAERYTNLEWLLGELPHIWPCKAAILGPMFCHCQQA